MEQKTTARSYLKRFESYARPAAATFYAADILTTLELSPLTGATVVVAGCSFLLRQTLLAIPARSNQ